MSTTKTTRRSLLASFPAIAAAMAPVTATALGELPASMAADPIFAAIEVYRQAEQEIAEYCDADAEEDWTAAALELAGTTPTTLAGCTALLTLYVEDEPWFNGSPHWHEHAMRNLADALTKLSGAQS